MMATRLLLLAGGLLGASGGTTLPAFYTKTDAFPTALKEATADCGAAASFHHEGGVPFVQLRTGDAAAHVVEKDHPQAPVRIMLVFGEHARELVSPELSLRLARDICASVKSGRNIARFMQADLRDGSGNGAAADVGTDSAAYASALQYLATQAFSILIVPLANAAGRRTVEQGQFCKRTNGADVDLNRNWDAHWQAADGTTVADSMPGAAPFSEPETQALRAVMLEFRPHMFLSVHSGTLGMYTPPAFAPDAEAGLADDPARAAQVGRLRRMLATVAGETPSVGGQTVVIAASKAADPARFMQQGLRSSASRGRAEAAAGSTAHVVGAGADTGRGSSGKGAGRRNRKLSHASSAISAAPRGAAGAAPVPFGGAAETVGYRCPGTCLDFAAENGGVGYSFAFEIWGTPTVSMSQQQQHRRRRHAQTRRAAGAAAGSGATGHAQRFRQMDGAMLDAAPAASGGGSGDALGGGAASAAAMVMEDLGALQPLIDELGGAGSGAAAAAGVARASGRGSAELGLLELESGGATAVEEGADASAGEGHSAATAAGAGADADAAAAAGAGVDADVGVEGRVQLHEVTVGSCFIERSATVSGDAAAALAASEASVGAAVVAGSQVDAEAEHEHSHEHGHGHGTASSAAAFLTAEECLGFFNPVAKADFQATMAAWSARTARLMQLVHAQVLQDRGVKPAQ
jgi:hypothetical protein